VHRVRQPGGRDEAEQQAHRRVAPVLTFLRDASLRPREPR
jgi:hypothetical protein